MSRFLLVLCLWVAPLSAAASEGAWTAVLRVTSPEDEALASRVRGQLSDLPVTLRTEPGPPPGESAQEQWRAALELARAHSARVAIWFQITEGEISVHLADPTSQRLLVRSIPVETRRGRAARSASAEAAALVVRSALSALLEGIPVGETVVGGFAWPLRPPEALASRVRADTDVFVEPPAPPAAPPPPSEGTWRVGLGWLAAVDGHSPPGQQGLQVGGAWEGARWRARAWGVASLPARLTDAYTRVSLARHAVGVGLDLTVRATERWRLGAGLGAGVAGFHRRTEVLSPDLEPTPSRLTLAPFAGPEVSARWRVGRVGLEGTLGADVLAGVPTLVYQQEGASLVRNPLWVVQPRLGLAIVLDVR
ncbi:hypothetical protein [Melittangium boletus]|uniref:hypothetical protein n=1 Tax=Melittangium boletus TaxID=83453 RepID=UPI003DA28B19